MTFSFRVAGTLITKTCAIVSAAAGTVRCQLSALDTAVAGVYPARFRVTWTGGDTESFPVESTILLVIAAAP